MTEFTDILQSELEKKGIIVDYCGSSSGGPEQEGCIIDLQKNNIDTVEFVDNSMKFSVFVQEEDGEARRIPRLSIKKSNAEVEGEFYLNNVPVVNQQSVMMHILSQKCLISKDGLTCKDLSNSPAGF